MTSVRPSFALVAAAIVALTSSCTRDTELDAKFATGFVHDGRSVSVFGVYKDGQMSSEEWAELAPHLGGSFGDPACAPGYAGLVHSGNAGLISAVDDYARANGPTDDLLTNLAPGARGDLIMVLSVAGHPPEQEKTSVSDESNSASLGGNGPGAGPAPSVPKPNARPRDTSEYNVAASFYSIADHRSVGTVVMTYTGATTADALAKFSSELRQSLPAAKCVGWSFEGLDAEDVRRKLEL